MIVGDIRGRVESGVQAGRVLTRAGILSPATALRLPWIVRAAQKWGLGPAVGNAVAVTMYPNEIGLVDERGAITFAEANRRANALANGLADAGVAAGDRVAVLCRNHRGFVDATVALARVGADIVYLNTGFAGPQLADVTGREGITTLIADQEFDDLLRGVDVGRRLVAWVDDPDAATAAGIQSLDELIDAAGDAEPPPPGRTSRVVILTSGTTGTPKGAARSNARSLDPAIALLSRIPLHTRQRVLIAAPLFHSWGAAHFTIGMALASTLIVHRRFDPEQTLAAIPQHRAEVLVVVPVMMQRMLDLPEATRRRYDTSSLKVVAVSGSALTGSLATDFMDAFGDVVYNLYGSTEVAYATIADPAQLRAAPGTAGTPPRGTTVKIYDDQGKEVPTGQTGRIFVGNSMLFEGYTGGGSKEVIDGLMSTGDVGHLDDDGRLFVEGRDDEMIVSGGENVFPAEVEDLLAGHAGVAEVAVVGVPDDDFGHRLKAFVVLQPGASLTAEEVQELVRANLARYKVPRDVEFLDALPRNATGKVLKRALSGG